MATSTNNDTRVFRSKTTHTSLSSVAMSSAKRCVRNWLHELRIGVGDRYGVGSRPLSPIPNCFHRGQSHVYRTGWPASMNHLRKLSWTPFDSVPGVGVRWEMKVGSKRLCTASTWSKRCGHWAAQNSNHQSKCQDKRPDPF